MRETWRWFGEFDPITLDEIAQTGAQGIVSALHAIPYGEIWSRGAIAKRRNEIEAAGFTWDVVESLPIHEDIKRGIGPLDQHFAHYRSSMVHLAKEGIKTICYNFMPILDWTRTDLTAPVARGGSCLHFSAAKMAALEMHMLNRDTDQYHPDALKAGDIWFHKSTETERQELLHAVMSGLPGAVDNYDIAGLKTVLKSYDGLSHSDLRSNLARFLNAVIPTADELGINLCIHPDDPPFSILGLPRIVCNHDDIRWILNEVDHPANGLTLCTGSLGSRPNNDLPNIARSFADRIHFVHLRNVTKNNDGSFTESAHLEGDVNMVAVIDALLQADKKLGIDVPFRADHGHALLSDTKRTFQPGYSLIGRLRGLSELRGIIAALS